MTSQPSDPLKEAMLVFAPELADDYRGFVRRMLKAMQDDIGPTLPHIYNNHRWARMFQGIRSNVWRGEQSRGVYNPRELDQMPYTLNEEAFDRNAALYGERVSLEWYHKMQEKLGGLDNIKVSAPARGGDITVTGTRDGSSVLVEQRRIVNVSPRGTLFHQFPARIYVDGRFKSEADYKKLFATPIPPDTMIDCEGEVVSPSPSPARTPRAVSRPRRIVQHSPGLSGLRQ